MSWTTTKNIEHYEAILQTAEEGPRREMVLQLLRQEKEKLARLNNRAKAD